jgi:DNA-binding transcriptional regulator YiaG
MGKVESIIKSEIVRLAKREMKQNFVPLSREVRSLKGTMSQLRKAVQGLQRLAVQQEKIVGGQKLPLDAAPEEVKKARFSPRLIKSLRKKLGITQKEMALLAGVTVGAIFQWEKGMFEPRGEKKKVLVALRRLRRREARKILEEKNVKMAPAKKSRPKGKTRKKAPRK